MGASHFWFFKLDKVEPKTEKIRNLCFIFKWQWRAVVNSGHGFEYERRFETRRDARQFKKSRPNIKIQRRLIQVDWEDYNDSFGWNNGCGKR